MTYTPAESETQPSTTGSLMSLPEELIERILLFATTPGRAALAATSKFFSRLATAPLYRDIAWIWEKILGGDLSLKLLLRTLSERPELALAIKNLDIATDEGSFPLFPNLARHLSEEEARLERYHIARSEFGPRLDAIRRLPPKEYLQDVNGTLALLILQTSNIQSLRLGFGAISCQFFVSRIVENGLMNEMATYPFSRFNSLTHIELPPDFDNRVQPFTSRSTLVGIPPINFTTCLASFYGPAVQSITMTCPEPRIFSWLDNPPVASRLQNLVLHHSDAKEETLGEFLSVAPNLKKLKYGFWCQVDNPYGTSEYLTCSKLCQTLDQVNSTLVELIISVNFFTFSSLDINEDGPFGLKGCVGSLCHFRTLEYLEIPLVVLLGWSPQSAPPLRDVLPSTLRKLCLTDDMSTFESWEWTEVDVLEQVKCSLINCETNFPNLKSIEVRDQHGGRVWNTYLTSQITSICHEAGLPGDTSS